MKEKILFVYDSMMTGGTTTALLSLINTIDRTKYDISLLLYTNTGDLIGEVPEFVTLLEPAYKKSKILNSGKRKIIRTALSGRVFSALRSYFKYKNTPKGNLRLILMHYGMASQVSLSRSVTEEYDYAISFMEGWSSEYVASEKIRAKKKFVWIHPQYKSCYLIPEIDRRTFERVDGIVLISENCLSQLFEYFPEYKDKTYVMPNITVPELIIRKSMAEEPKVKKTKINFCTVCRCDVQVKGLDRLLKAFHELKSKGLAEDVSWHLIGGGGEYEDFRREVEALGMTDTVILYGNKLNPLPYLRQMDVFILASRYEGKPLSVTEAQILGLPCIVTNYKSAPSQIKHGFNGLITENSYEGVYGAISDVICDPDVISEWKKNAAALEHGNVQDIKIFYDLLHKAKEA